MPIRVGRRSLAHRGAETASEPTDDDEAVAFGARRDRFSPRPLGLPVFAHAIARCTRCAAVNINAFVNTLIARYYALQSWLCGYAARVDWIFPLGLRLYLAPVLIVAGLHKFQAFDATSAWFGTHLGMPLPGLMTFLAASAELFGGLALVIGLATRWVSVPLLVTMLVAAGAVHWDKGWFAIAPSNPTTSVAAPLAAIGIPAAKRSLENSVEVAERLSRAKDVLRTHADYNWLTEKGSFAILNNGIEFAFTYLLMLIGLIFIGGGRWVSVDYWLDQRCRRRLAPDSDA